MAILKMYHISTHFDFLTIGWKSPVEASIYTKIVKTSALVLCCVFFSYGSLWAESAYDFSVQVLDEMENPISGAKVDHGFFSKIVPFDKQRTETISDAMGLVKLKGTAHDLGRIVVTKPGFYTSRERPSAYLNKGWNGKRHTNWGPDGKILKIALKSSGTAVPMFAKYERKRIPGGATGRGVGFDLEVGDLVWPDGTGKSSDIVFYARAWGDSEDDLRWSLAMEFPNKGDGIVEISSPIGSDAAKMRGSELRSPTIAPLSGYRSAIDFYYDGENERQGTKDSIYVFRVRTVLDDGGNVRSALYGKIYKSPWVGRVVKERAADPQQRDWLHFGYFLNPDGTRNLRFDPQRNLFGKLPVENSFSVP